MSEQLWYTWSDSGFGNALGYRVRAASPNLTDVASQRIRNFIDLLGYTLSRDTDLFLPPQEAPLCLAFLKAGPNQESILIQKTYTGLDGFKRPGVFFSHLLTELPPVPSPCLGGQVPFSAREAINLWRATTLWHDTDTSLRAGERNLKSILPADLFSGAYAGPLNEQYVMSKPELFRSALQAFLTLALSGERKRLYLVGSPDKVAALIWGITHALPRTLTIMLDLTFSTFESNIENDTKLLIVGTCWLPQYLQKGHENAPLDLPLLYYQPNSPYGIAINCDFPQNQTPFTLPHPLVAKYTQFVLDCFQQGSFGITRLTMMLDKAEKRNISEVMGFLNHYVDSQEMLKKEDVTRILRALHDRVEFLMTQAEKVLQQDRLSVAAAEAAQVESIEAEAEMLTQDNVQQSIMNLILQDKDWWKTQGQPLIGKLYELAGHYSKGQLTKLSDQFVYTVIESKAWRKNQGGDLISTIRPLVANYRNYATPQELLSAFAKEIENRVIEAQKALRKALHPIASSIADQLVRVMQADQYEATVYWCQAFSACVDVANIPTEVWAELLQQLARGAIYNPTYQKLWQQYCKQKIAFLRPNVRSTATTAIATAFTAFATYAGKELLTAIQTRTASTPTLLFWSDVLATSAPPTSEPTVWVDQLNQFAGLAYTPTYAQWWQDFGKVALTDIQMLTNKNRESELGQAFSSFILRLFSSLQVAIKSGQSAELSLWEQMLSTLAPASSQPLLWMDLLLNVRDALTAVGFRQWWREQGSEVLHHLLRFTETSQGNIAVNLTSFAQAVVDLLARSLIEEAQRGTQEYEASISFLFDVLNASVPVQETGISLILLQTLTNAYVYKSIRWERRSALLQQWKSVPALQQKETQAMLALWFEVSWGDLERFLALALPDTWAKIAITKALETYAHTSPQLVLDAINRYPALFEEVLQSLIQAYQKAYQVQPIAIQFFTFLAQHSYANTIPLLGKLLAAIGYQKDLAEQLLLAAQLVSNKDIVELLELHCKVMLASYELPPTMLRLIEQYLANFDVEYLDADPTRILLLNLQQRDKVPSMKLPPHVQQSVTGWYKLSEFLSQPKASHNSLRELSHSIRNMSQLIPDMQKKLTAKLTPHLVALVITEADLTRVLDNLGRGTQLQLLQEMARIAGEKYGQERPPLRIAPYVRIILGESNQLEGHEKEIFIDTCLQLLFKQTDAKTRDKYLPEQLWPKAFVDEWNVYLIRLRSISLKKGLNHFREAAKRIYIPALLSAYDAAFDPYLTAEERKLLERATTFAQAYNANNDVAIVKAYQVLKDYYTEPLYDQEQNDRINLAGQRIAQQQASAQSAVGNVHSSSIWQGGIGSHSAVPPVNNGQNAPVSQIASGQNVAPLATAGSSSPASAASQGNVAIAKGQSIPAAWLIWVLPLRKLYITERIEDILLEMKHMEDRGEARQKQYKQRKDEHQALKKLQNDEKRLREVALYDLIQDIFIKEEIADTIQRDAIKRTAFDEIRSNEQIKQLYNKLRVRYQHRYSILGSNDTNIQRDVQEVLAMFVRREQFTTYLSQYRQIGLDEWWREQLQREGANIKIDFKQAGLPAPRGGFLSLFGL